MKWIEIISVRSSGREANILEQDLLLLMEQVNQVEHGKMKIYRQHDLTSDISIHLHHGSELKLDGSTLGLRLVSSLQEHGIVNHTIWQNILPIDEDNIVQNQG